MSWNRIRPLRDRTLAKPRTIGLAAAAVALAVLLYAWIDGGEEPLRPIAQPIDLPERAR
jgi:hypothetical protein